VTPHESSKVVTYNIVIFADQAQSLPWFLNNPCRCCGQNDHSLLRIENEGDYRKMIYGCPVVLIGDDAVDASKQVQHNYLKYRACPAKMVEKYAYCPEAIEAALQTYQKKGDGAYLSQRSLTEFIDEARRKYIGKQDHDVFRRSDYLHSPLSDFSINESKVDMCDIRAPIFCDLDGVLVDFEAGIKKIFKKLPNEIPKKVMWATVAKVRGFYANLPWMKDGKELWESIKRFNPIILTAAPKGSWAEKQKREWVNRELGAQVRMIVSTTKYEHCPPSIPPAILIDDRNSHCENWTRAGGNAILHSSATATIGRLTESQIQFNEMPPLDFLKTIFG